MRGDRASGWLEASLRALARPYPWSASASDGLERALDFLGAGIEPEVVVRAGYGLGMIGASITLLLWGALDLGYAGLLAAIALVLLAVHVVHVAPRTLALARRTRALGSAPDLVARAVLSMRLSPSPERAAAFAAESGDGPLTGSMAGHVWRARATGADALETFAREWEEWYPGLGRALELVSAAGEMDGHDRERTLERALSVVLEGTRSQMRSFATRINRPVTALYAFGVLLPTTLVALLPAASAAGVGVTTLTVVVVYDLLLPLGIVGASIWLVVRRPVAFPPPHVDRSHPDVPDRTAVVLGIGPAAGVVAWIAAAAFLPSWAGPFAAVGIGSGTVLWLHFRPVVAIYGRIRELESGLTDALALVGRRVANGVAVESAIEAAAADVDGVMGAVLDSGVSRQRQLNVGVTEAFLGDYGALSDLPSPRVRGSMAVLGLAAQEGEPAGSALLALADHVDELHRIERDSRQDLENVCGTLQGTGALFGPMVAGATVALADGIASGSTLPGGGQSLPWLGVAVGGYVLAFAVVLSALATSLARGFDRPLVGHRVGRALVCATVVYLASYLLVAGVA
jgi:Flp pilus assembly protein TadB